MTLPVYNNEITLEEALNQFDYATERLVLLPRGKRNIRNHVFDAATDAALSSSRFIETLEKDYKNNGLNLNLIDLFLEGISRGLGVLEKMRDLYNLMQQTEEEPEQLKGLRRERSIVENYASLMSLRLSYARDIKSQIRKT